MTLQALLFDNYIINHCFKVLLPLVFLYLFRCIFYWLACNTDLFGRYFAILYLWLPKRFNIGFVFSPSTQTTKNSKNVLTFIDFYCPYVYWAMCLDSPRVNAYEEAVRQIEQKQQKLVWFDIGTGAHMPLTSLLLKHEVAEHVYAVEANRKTYLLAKQYRETLPDDKLQKVSLYNCFSSDIDWNAHKPRPNAIIQEIIGSVSSDEGCIKVLHETIKNLNADVSVCIPYQIGTLCMPVSHPKPSLLSSLCSIFFFGTFKFLKSIGIQGSHNPPKDAFLCENPQFIEKFILQEYASKPLDKYAIFQTKFIVNKSVAGWTGFYLAPHVLTAKESKNGATEIDGFKNLTSWPVNYIHMFNDQDGISVKKGDEIHVILQSDLNDTSPTYRLEAWINDDYILRRSFVWKGPTAI